MQEPNNKLELEEIAKNIFDNKETLIELEQELDSLYSNLAYKVAFEEELKNDMQRKTMLTSYQNSSEEYLECKKQVNHIKNYIEYLKTLLDVKLSS